ncbi:MAG TPA: hypothetical protein VF109_12580 [Mycobacteriales bacterium]
MPVDAGSYHYVVGPVLAIVVVALLAAAMRWIFGNGRSRAGAAAAEVRDRPVDHGLLRPVAELPDRAAGTAVRAVLSDAGIRSTLGVRKDGRVQVLVFADDLDAARRLVPPSV